MKKIAYEKMIAKYIKPSRNTNVDKEELAFARDIVHAFHAVKLTYYVSTFALRKDINTDPKVKASNSNGTAHDATIHGLGS